jgi:hypothetical protein
MANSRFIFSEEKSRKLKSERGLSFKEIIGYIESGYLISTTLTPDQEKFPGEKMYLVNIKEYVWLVPHERKEGKILLKTAFPSQKATKTYLKGEQNETG